MACAPYSRPFYRSRHAPLPRRHLHQPPPPRQPSGRLPVPRPPTWPEDGQTQRVAAELNQSETAFALPVPGEGATDREVRWFTPAADRLPGVGPHGARSAATATPWGSRSRDGSTTAATVVGGADTRQQQCPDPLGRDTADR
ncbi:PhzF family phenazine biosynthesis protein [Streptomyces sp. AJS327]|nr:PhzF family phenazine biosynthesis protein [Streptomyces sp. AJS327]